MRHARARHPNRITVGEYAIAKQNVEQLITLINTLAQRPSSLSQECSHVTVVQTTRGSELEDADQESAATADASS